MEAPGTEREGGGGEVWVSARYSAAQQLHLNVNKGVLTGRIIMPPVC